MTAHIERIRRTILPPILAVGVLICIYFSLLATRVALPMAVNTSVGSADYKPRLTYVQSISLPLPLPATEAISEIKNASIFAQSRQPWVVEPAVSEIHEGPETAVETLQAQVPAERQRPNLNLIGIMRGDNSARALISNPDTVFEKWVAVGDSIENWVVVEIQANSLLLRSGNNEFVVSYNR